MNAMRLLYEKEYYDKLIEGFEKFAHLIQAKLAKVYDEHEY